MLVVAKAVSYSQSGGQLAKTSARRLSIERQAVMISWLEDMEPLLMAPRILAYS